MSDAIKLPSVIDDTLRCYLCNAFLAGSFLRTRIWNIGLWNITFKCSMFLIERFCIQSISNPRLIIMADRRNLWFGSSGSYLVFSLWIAGIL